MHRYKQNKRDDQSAANHRQTTSKPTLYIPFRPGDGLFCDPTPAPAMPEHKKKRGAVYLETKYTSDESEEEFKEQDDEDEDESDEDVVPPKKSPKTTRSRRRRV
jgi:hypothetical protein